MRIPIHDEQNTISTQILSRGKQFRYEIMREDDKYLLRKLNGRHLLNSLTEIDFKCLIEYCCDKFEKFLIDNSVDIVIYSETPHTAYDYLFVLISKSLGIKNVSLEMVGPIGRSCSFINDMNKRKMINISNKTSEKCLNLQTVVKKLDVKSDTPYGKSVIDTMESDRRQMKLEILHAIYNNDINGNILDGTLKKYS